MRRLLLAACALTPLAATADDELLRAAHSAFPDAQWDQAAALRADIDCDGKPDVAMIGTSKTQVIVALFRGGHPLRPNALSYPAERFASPRLQLEALDVSSARFRQMIGAKPAGYHRSDTCMGLRLTGDGGAELHFYWYVRKSELLTWSR